MGRYCSSCEQWCYRDDFSRNRWAKGDGYSRCYDCVNNVNYSYSCSQCDRWFSSQNALNMHMQTHRPRNVACPICGEQRFRSGANAVQHVESGFCSGCQGRDNARQQIYNFASQQRQMQRYMDTPLLTNGGYNDSYVPDFPYHCPDCSKSFRQLSQLLQHQDQKHNQTRMLTYR